MQQTLSEMHTRLDLDNCAREPIRTPGKIQAHGYLLTLKLPELHIHHASANLQNLFGIDVQALFGKAFYDFITPESLSELHLKLCAPNPSIFNPIKMPLKLPLNSPGERQLFDAIIHRSQDLLILELEPSSSSATPSFSNIYQAVNAAIKEMADTKNILELCQKTADYVKQLSGYERIMIYQFDAQWNGKVIAEARDLGQESFMGLQYPASDIPAQARELYRSNWLRIIPNVHYEPVAILSSSKASGSGPLDLSGSVLRSVSPVHIQYLKNMKVGASMSVSVIKDQQLWGLIACHHSDAAYLSYEIRQALEFIGKFFSLQLAAREKHENLDYRLYLKSLQSQMLDKMRQEPHFIDGLYRKQPDILKFAQGCSGAAIYYQAKFQLLGITPTEVQLQGLVEWLKQMQGHQALYSTTSLAKLYAPAKEFKQVASGLLSLSIPEVQTGYVIWFKPEVVQTVNWSGNPEKPMEITEQGVQLSPRRSFALWKETVELSSLPWALEELEAVELLRRSIIEVDLERQVRLAMESNEELDQYASIIAHDLKEPLRGIGTFAQFLEADMHSKLDSESKLNLSEIRQLTHKAQRLISELYEYSKLGKLELSFAHQDLNQVVMESYERLKALFIDQMAQLKFKHELPIIYCDRIRISEVFANLMGNALKYNDKDQKIVEVGMQGNAFYVKDNGIGIANSEQHRVFKMFERLHGPNDFGGGTGIGLAIVKKIIERHGGNIWLESSPQQGTTFFFTLGPERKLTGSPT